MTRRFSRLVPSMSLMGLLLLAPTVGSAQRFGVQGQTGTAGRGGSTPTNQGRGQQPPATPQTGSTQSQSNQQRPPQTAETALTGWTWWKDEAVKKELQLTDRQAQNINRIYEKRVRDITPAFDDLQKQIVELDRMAKERKVDVNAYAYLVSRAEFNRSKLNETRLVMLYEIAKLLSDEQNLKLKDIRDRRWNSRGRGAGPRPW